MNNTWMFGNMKLFLEINFIFPHIMYNKTICVKMSLATYSIHDNYCILMGREAYYFNVIQCRKYVVIQCKRMKYSSIFVILTL